MPRKASSLLDTEAWNPGRGSQCWYQLHRAFSSQDPALLDLCAWRCQQETDWPRLEDPFVEVVFHLAELDPSHVQACLEDLEPFCCCHSLYSLNLPDHSTSSWTPNASTIEVSKSVMCAIHSAILLWTDHHLLVSFLLAWHGRYGNHPLK